MVGFKGRLNESVQFKLSFTLSLAILIVAIVAGIFSFMSAFDEAHELQDDVLRQIAQLVDRQRLTPSSPAMDSNVLDGDKEARVIVQRLGETGSPPRNQLAGGALALPTTLTNGLHTLKVGDETFRVLVKTTAAGERIAVSQESSFRNGIARDGALRTLMPFLILIPVLLLVVANLVRTMFRPIAALSRDIDGRDEQELHPIEAGDLPAEVRPFAIAINRLLARVSESMDTQRRFVADAAHELRSPLTAMSLQAERLENAAMSALARELLVALHQGIERGKNLLDQLLTLAKVQSLGEPPDAPVLALNIYRRVLEDLLPLAEAKRIDIGIEVSEDAEVCVSELDMIILVKDLVDNAIRYTPEGGRVDLSLATADGRTVLRVRDSGPGIPVGERDRVFDPFYRSLGSDQAGSGLGLSIVQTIARRVGARIRLDFTDNIGQTGVDISVSIPVGETAGCQS